MLVPVSELRYLLCVFEFDKNTCSMPSIILYYLFDCGVVLVLT